MLTYIFACANPFSNPALSKPLPEINPFPELFFLQSYFFASLSFPIPQPIFRWATINQAKITKWTMKPYYSQGLCSTFQKIWRIEQMAMCPSLMFLNMDYVLWRIEPCCNKMNWSTVYTVIYCNSSFAMVCPVWFVLQVFPWTTLWMSDVWPTASQAVSAHFPENTLEGRDAAHGIVVVHGEGFVWRNAKPAKNTVFKIFWHPKPKTDMWIHVVGNCNYLMLVWPRRLA